MSAHIPPFEANEKRLEIDFFFNDDATRQCRCCPGERGLRLLSRKDVEFLLPCSVISHATGNDCDAYVLSESSLFVYPAKWVIKTCGTVGLFKCLPALVASARTLGLNVARCEYSRSGYFFPHEQPFPHSCFQAETEHLERELFVNLGVDIDEDSLDSTCIHDMSPAALGRADLPLTAWLTFEAIARGTPQEGSFTRIEIRMAGLDWASAHRFFPPHSRENVTAELRNLVLAGGNDTENGHSITDAHMFSPCGYSMNGFLRCGGFYTVHVTPQEPGSYASVEVCFRCGKSSNVKADRHDLIRGVVEYFSPSRVMTVMRRSVGFAEWKVDFISDRFQELPVTARC